MDLKNAWEQLRNGETTNCSIDECIALMEFCPYEMAKLIKHTLSEKGYVCRSCGEVFKNFSSLSRIGFDERDTILACKQCALDWFFTL